VGDAGKPLRLPVFRRLFAAYTANEIGDSVALVALALLVFEQTGSAAATTLLFVATRFLPAFLAPLLIARIDAQPARVVLPVLYAIEGLVFVALAALADAFWLPLVLLLGLADGTVALAARGRVRASVAAVLAPVDALREGNGLMNVGFALAAVVGAGLGGALVAWAGFAAALLADAGSFFLIAALLARTRGLPRTESDPELGFRERLGGGFAFVRDNAGIRLLLVGQAVALVLFTLIVPIEVVYARETLRTDEAGFGLLLATWGTGIVLGSFVFIASTRRSPLALVVASTAAVGVAYVGMSLVDTLAAACALSVLGGLGNGVQWVAVMTALQAATPLALQARVVGLFESLAAAVPGVGFLVGGILTTLSGPATAYAVAGWGLLGLLLAGALLRSRLQGLAAGGAGSASADSAPAPVGPVPVDAVPDEVVGGSR
jgi:predicted MFS family arabinose efflux permease